MGERNGNWKGGRYSRIATPEQRRKAWQEHWAAKRAARADTADILYVTEELQTLWPQD